MGWIGCACCEKFRCDFVARSFALVWPVLHRVCKTTKRSQMHLNGNKLTKTCVLGPMGWIMCVHCEKFQCNFVAQTFALVRPVLHRVSKGNLTVPNAPKRYETHQNISLGSKGVDRVRSLRKILMRLRGTKFCTSSDRFAPSFLRQPNRCNYTQMVRNSPKHEFRV